MVHNRTLDLRGNEHRATLADADRYAGHMDYTHFKWHTEEYVTQGSSLIECINKNNPLLGISKELVCHAKRTTS